MRIFLYCLLNIGVLLVILTTDTLADNINMSEVRKLAKLSVDEILTGSPVHEINVDTYWKTIRDRKRPKVVFFYSNNDGPSQRVATLIRFVAMDYSDRMTFRRVKVVETGKPDVTLKNDYESRFSLDKTPGILFYDNVNDKMVLEDEDYVDADFKEFRTPKMLLWKTYYSAVRKELDLLLAD